MAPIVAWPPVNFMPAGYSYKPCSQGLPGDEIHEQYATDPRFPPHRSSITVGGKRRTHLRISFDGVTYFHISPSAQG